MFIYYLCSASHDRNRLFLPERPSKVSFIFASGKIYMLFFRHEWKHRCWGLICRESARAAGKKKTPNSRDFIYICFLSTFSLNNSWFHFIIFTLLIVCLIMSVAKLIFLSRFIFHRICRIFSVQIFTWGRGLFLG